MYTLFTMVFHTCYNVNNYKTKLNLNFWSIYSYCITVCKTTGNSPIDFLSISGNLAAATVLQLDTLLSEL